MRKISERPRSPNAQGFLTPKASYIYIILYLIYMYDSHIVAMTHAIIYMHHQYNTRCIHAPDKQLINEVIQRHHLVIYLAIIFNIVEDNIRSP